MKLYEEIEKLHTQFTTREIIRALADFQQRQRAKTTEDITKEKYNFLYVSLTALSNIYDGVDRLLLS
jgi:hypothetical protein